MLAAACIVSALSAGCSERSVGGARSALPELPARAPRHPATWSIEPLAGPFRSGMTTTVRVTAKLEDGWHVYSLTQPAGGPRATRISVPAGQPFILAGLPSPTVKPQVKYDGAFRMNVQEHERGVTFDIPVRATRLVAGPADSIRVEVRYQVCDASLCYPPQTARLAEAVTAGSARTGE